MSNTLEVIVTSTIAGIVAGLVVLAVQALSGRIKENKEKNEKKRVGKRTDKFIDQEFLNNYMPGFLSIEKVVSDFGQPYKVIDSCVIIKWDNNRKRDLTIYQYDFTNAIIQFSTFRNESTVISITVNSNLSRSHPVKFCFAFAGEDVNFGEAKINDEILNNKVNFESQMYRNWGYSAIQAKYFYREIKDLTFTYIVCDIFETENEMLGKTIDQLCISANEDVYPVIYFYDMK